jgi:hypothetical protein
MAKQSAASKAKAAATLGGMKGAVFTLTGDGALISTLNGLRDSVARRAIKKGLTKAVRILTKGMKAQVPVNLKSMKRAIGGRIGSGHRGKFTAKAGAAVGKAAKAEPRPRKNRGVGIGGSNIHWWILGTGQRTSSRGPTGAMPAMAAHVIKAGFSSAAGQAAEVIKSEISAELAKPHKAK